MQFWNPIIFQQSSQSKTAPRRNGSGIPPLHGESNISHEPWPITYPFSTILPGNSSKGARQRCLVKTKMDDEVSKRNRHLKLKLSVDDMCIIEWYVDTSFSVHDDYKAQTRVIMVLEKDTVLASSQKQEMNGLNSM